MGKTDDRKIKIFDITDDEHLKLFGELTSSVTGRRIIRALFDDEYYTNELSKKLDIPSNLAGHHLEKLEELGLLDIRIGKIIKKGVDRKFYRMRTDIFVTHTKDESFLKRIFKDGIKFVSVAIVFIFIGSSTISENDFKVNKTNYPESFGVNVYQAVTNGVDVSQTATNSLEFWIYPLIVLVIALICERVIFGIKKRKRG